MKLAVIALIASLTFQGIALSAEPPNTILMYEVDAEFLAEDELIEAHHMVQLVAAVNRRVNPGWFPKARVEQLGDRRIGITVVGDKPELVARIERLLSHTGTLEFRILANSHDHAALIERAKALPVSKTRLLEENGNRSAWWVAVQQGKENQFDNLREIAIRKAERNGREILEILVACDKYNVTGKYLVRIKPETDFRGRPCLEFTLNQAGGKLFGKLTGSNLPDGATGARRQLGIILNGSLHSAPSILSRVGQRGQITGSFSRQDVQDLADVLNAGTLPLAIKKVEFDDKPKP